MHLVYKIMFFVSIVLVTLAMVVIVIFGLRFGVDFRGGSVLEISFDKERPAPSELGEVMRKIKGVTDASVSPVGEQGIIIRLNAVDEAAHQEILEVLSTQYGKVIENRFDSIGPTVGNELRNKSITAIIVLLVAITGYIAFVFRKLSKVLSPWAMSVATVVALLHDVLIPIGVFSLLGRYVGVEVSAVFVAAVLTILGYSVSDSVVVFDRVRENVLRFGSTAKFDILVHRSIMQTLSRSLNTTFTTLLSLIAIYFFGGESVKYFALALIIGIFLGAYSSIFVASPVLVWWSGRRDETRGDARSVAPSKEVG